MVCPSLTYLDRAHISTPIAVYGTEVEITCYQGSHFPSNHTNNVVSCLDNGEWNDTITDCEGEL